MEIVLASGMYAPFCESIAKGLARQGYEVQFLEPIDQRDIDAGLVYIDNDACVATAALFGQYIRYLEESNPLRALLLAAPLCVGCRSSNPVPLLRVALHRAGWLERVQLVDASLEPVFSDLGENGENAGAFDELRVGICAPTSLMTSPFFYQAIAECVEHAGGVPKPVPLEVVANKPDAIKPALSYFQSTGVRTIICVIPFGCLSGNVHSRGFMRMLREDFPDLDITVLDYDSSASEINIVNRVELVVQSALESTEERAQS